MGILGLGFAQINTFYGGRKALVYKGRADSALNKTILTLLGVPGYLERRQAKALKKYSSYFSERRTPRIDTEKLRIYAGINIAENVKRLMKTGQREKAGSLAMLGLLKDSCLLSHRHGFLNDSEIVEIFLRSGDHVMFRKGGMEKFMLALANLSASCQDKMISHPIYGDPLFTDIGFLYSMYRMNELFLRRDLDKSNVIGAYFSDFFIDHISHPKAALMTEARIRPSDLLQDYPIWARPIGNNLSSTWKNSKMEYKATAFLGLVPYSLVSFRAIFKIAVVCSFDLMLAADTPIAPLILFIARRRHNMQIMEHYGLLADQSRMLFSHHKVEMDFLPSYLSNNGTFSPLSWVHEMYATLNYLKYRFPKPVEATPEKAGFDPKKSTVAILSDMSEDSMALLREGGRSAEANFLMVLHDNWLKHFPWSRHPIRVREALTFSRGVFYKLKFREAQQIGYLLDFTETLAKHRIARNIPVPSNTQVEALTNNKDITFELLRLHGVKNIPMTREIGNDLSPDNLRTKILSIFSRSSEIVIKPTNGSCGSNVTFFTAAEADKAVQYISGMLAKKSDVLVQERIIPPMLRIGKENHDWNLRLFAAKNGNGETVVSDIAVRYDGKKGPVNISLGAKVMTFEELTARLRLDAATARKLRKKIVDLSVKAFTAVEEETRQAQKHPKPWRDPDFMGIDIMVRSERGSLVPYIIEMNDYHAGGMWDLDSVVTGNRVGKSSRDFVSAMARKAKLFG
jgi:hypothetical protein